MAANREIGDAPLCEYSMPVHDPRLDVALNAASEGCHSTRQLVMSDKQTTMSNDTLEKIACLRNHDSRPAVTVLKKIYVNARGEARRA